MKIKLSEPTQAKLGRVRTRVTNPVKHLKGLALFGAGYALGKASPRFREKLQRHYDKKSRG